MISLRITKGIFLFVIIILAVGCDFKLYNEPEVGEGNWREDFIATMNIDGSDVQLIQSQHQTSFAGARPYFVRDLAGNYDDEVILLDFASRIDIMSLNGEYRRTIIDSLGGVQYFNQDRTKMIVLHDEKVYLCNVDGAEVYKISLDSAIRCYTPSFSFDDSSILYCYVMSNENNIVKSGIIEYIIDTNESIILLGTIEHEDHLLNISYSHPSRSDEEIITYRYIYKEIDSEVIVNRYNFRKHDLMTNNIDILTEGYIELKYSNLNGFVVFERGNDRNEYLLSLETLSIMPFDTSLYDIDDASFSSDDRYLMLNEIIYDTQSDSTFILEESDFFGKYHHISKTHMNSNNTKIVGIVGFLHY